MTQKTLSRNDWRKSQVLIKLQSFNLTLADVRQAAEARRNAPYSPSDESSQAYSAKLALLASIHSDVAERRNALIARSYDRSDELLDADIARNANIPESDIAVIIERAIEATADQPPDETVIQKTVDPILDDPARRATAKAEIASGGEA